MLDVARLTTDQTERREALGERPREEPAGGANSSSRFVDLLVVARGDGAMADGALEDLLTALCAPIRRLATSRLRGCADAPDVVEDVVQETLIRLAGAVRSCRATTDAAVVGWACATARHTLIDMYRSPGTGLAARQLAQELLEDVVQYEQRHGGDESVVGSPAMISLLGVMMAAYNDAVESTGELFWWRLIMGLEWTEIGEKLSTTAAGAKRRFQRAQDTLRREVMRRVAVLPDGERADVLALLGRFGYAEARMGKPVATVPTDASMPPQSPSCSRRRSDPSCPPHPLVDADARTLADPLRTGGAAA